MSPKTNHNEEPDLSLKKLKERKEALKHLAEALEGLHEALGGLHQEGNEKIDK